MGQDIPEGQYFPSPTALTFSHEQFEGLVARSSATCGPKEILQYAESPDDTYEWEFSGVRIAADASLFGGELGMISVITWNYGCLQKKSNPDGEFKFFCLNPDVWAHLSYEGLNQTASFQFSLPYSRLLGFFGGPILCRPLSWNYPLGRRIGESSCAFAIIQTLVTFVEGGLNQTASSSINAIIQTFGLLWRTNALSTVELEIPPWSVNWRVKFLPRPHHSS
jgi:hypothetical protein